MLTSGREPSRTLRSMSLAVPLYGCTTLFSYGNRGSRGNVGGTRQKKHKAMCNNTLKDNYYILP